MFSYESDFCWQIAPTSLQHLRTCHILNCFTNCNILNQDPNTSGCQRFTVLQIISWLHISTAAVVRYLDSYSIADFFLFLLALLIFRTKKENELKPAIAAGLL